MDYKETLDVVKKQNPGPSYKEVLADVKAKNPDKTHRECQKIAGDEYKVYTDKVEAIAKKLFNTYKEGQSNLNAAEGAKLGGSAGQAPDHVIHTAANAAEIADAEKKIRQKPIDVNSVMSIGREVIYDGALVNHGKADNMVNSLVTYENNDGDRFPREGFFEVFI
jgi:hypothetical protein